MDKEQFISTIAPLAVAKMQADGVLASVTIAQAILESGWGTSELAVKACNLFGMKSCLSGNTWPSKWDGELYITESPEWEGGVKKIRKSVFRRYSSWAESIADRNAYLLGALDGDGLRYSGLKGEKDPARVVRIIATGDYASDPNYADKLLTLINQYNLVRYDNGEENENMKMKILLISGHGAGDSGATSPFGVEANLTVEAVQLLKAKLEAYAQVDLYPVERNAFKDLHNGGLVVNPAGYDYVLEIHFDASQLDAGGDGRTKGTGCFVCREEAGISVEEAMCANVAALGLANRGVRRKNFDVIDAVKNRYGVSSCLYEVCFVDDADDMAVFNAKKDQVYQAMANGIISGFGLAAGGEVPTAPETSAEYPWVGAVQTNDGSLLNVRTGPGTTYANLAAWPKLANSNRVEVIGKEGAWLQVNIASRCMGWVHGAYIKRVPA